MFNFGSNARRMSTYQNAQLIERNSKWEREREVHIFVPVGKKIPVVVSVSLTSVSQIIFAYDIDI